MRNLRGNECSVFCIERLKDRFGGLFVHDEKKRCPYSIFVDFVSIYPRHVSTPHWGYMSFEFDDLLKGRSAPLGIQHAFFSFYFYYYCFHYLFL